MTIDQKLMLDPAVVDDPYAFYDELREAADKYENSGVPLSTAFAKYTSVDAQVTHMLAIGATRALGAVVWIKSTIYLPKPARLLAYPLKWQCASLKPG